MFEQNAIRYRHTQRGTTLLATMLLAGFLAAVLAFLNPAPPGLWILSVVAIGSMVLAWLFSSLTVEVNEQDLHWHFGPGLWTYRIALADIESFRPVRNKWWYGFGIRKSPGFRLYNVSGLDAVELRLKAGGVRRIGTDDASGLAAALRA
jgi:hypothetical protein